jgi:hypothetical protein
MLNAFKRKQTRDFSFFSVERKRGEGGRGEAKWIIILKHMNTFRVHSIFIIYINIMVHILKSTIQVKKLNL